MRVYTKKSSENKPTTIVYINLYSEMAGGEYALYNLLKGIDREQFKPVMIFNRRGEFSEKVKALGCEVIFISFRNVMLKKLIYPKGFFKLISDSVKIYGFLKSNKPDIIQVSDVLSLIMVAIPALIVRVPILYSMIFFYERSRMTVFNLLALFFVKKIIANSTALKNDLLRRTFFLPKEIEVVYHAVDVERFSPRKSSGENLILKELSLPSNAKVIGMVGRFDPWKGHDVFLRAMAEVINERPELIGVVIGGQLFVDVFTPFQKYHDEVIRLHRELELDGKVFFLSNRTDMPDVLQSLDVLVCPSTRENIPLSIFEAMACKVPVVAADVGGISEQIEDGKTGFLFKSGDHKALADAVLECLNSDSDKITEGAYQKLNRQFKMEIYISSMESVYRTFI